MAGKQTALALAGVPRVNLMPRAESERRERLALTRTWAVLAIGAVVLALAVVAGAFYMKWTADQALAAEQVRTETLISELAAQSEVTQALAARDVRESFRGVAMANDFAWTPIIDDLVGSLPAGVSLIEYSLTPGPAPTDADPETQVGSSGPFTYTTSDSRLQAATVAALAKTPGVLSADAGALFTSGEGTYEFTVNVTLDQTIYSGDYAADGSAD